MKQLSNKLLVIITVVLVIFYVGFLIPTFGQATTITLPTADSTSSFNVDDSNNTNILKVSGDGSLLSFGSFNTSLSSPSLGGGTRLWWYPKKSAFRVGSVSSNQWDGMNVGLFSYAIGRNTTAIGFNSTAMGFSTTASGMYSTAIGKLTNATGLNSTAMGNSTTANGDYSTAIGYSTVASGLYSLAMGRNTIANKESSIALGYNTTASGLSSTAMGDSTSAIGDYSTAMGRNTTASGLFSTAMGLRTTASGPYSTAMGSFSTASWSHSIAMGLRTTASANFSIAIGRHTTASGHNSTAMGFSTTASGMYSTAMGIWTIASGNYSTAMGHKVSTNSKSGSFIIGDQSNTKATISTADNQMLMRFAGGYIFYSNSNISTGSLLLPNSTAWSSSSDSTKKENFIYADGEYFLRSLSKIKLGSWNYKGLDPAKYRHYGAMAQEIFHYFGKDKYGVIGVDSLVNTLDMDGIQMIALQALVKRTDELKIKNDELRITQQKIEVLENKLAIQKTRLNLIVKEFNNMRKIIETLAKEKKAETKSSLTLNN